VLVAYVHDWLVTYRGGEAVLAALLELYPEAPVYTLFYDEKAMPPAIKSRDVRPLAWTNALKPLRKALLPILPRAIEAIDLQDFDLIVSTSSCVAKGAIKRPDAKHLCYLHSPMRYIWDQQDEYLQGLKRIPGAATVVRALTPALRRWDVASASRVDRYVANSTFVAERARTVWGRADVGVVPPPIDLARFKPRAATTQRGGYFLAAGAFVSYKRFDLAIQACEAAGKQLIVAGSGPIEPQLRRLAGAHTRFEIQPSDARFAELMAGAEALLFPGVEDFGMVAVEAMASGTPVLALRAGGARDFVEPGVTGEFFDEPTPVALASLLRAYNPQTYNAQTVAATATRYGKDSFLRRMRAEIATLTGKDARA
jgi:glycosyltransferase involved in cell wall biosynthesis